MATVCITQIKVEGDDKEVAAGIKTALESFVRNGDTDSQKKTADAPSPSQSVKHSPVSSGTGERRANSTNDTKKKSSR